MDRDFRINSWLVQPRLNSVFRDGSTVRLEPKLMAVLVCLANHAPEPVSKEELLQAVWPDTFVGEGVLFRSIVELRRVFEDEAKEPRVIQTIAKRGYRLVAGLTLADGKETPVSVEDSIAVLPFVNLSADPENEFFSDGTTEEIISALAHIKNLHVVARTSVFAFKGKQVDLRTIGAQLKVRTILEGSIRRSGDRLRITAQLVNAADGYHLWSETYDREMKDVFAIQEDIAHSIAERLEITLDAGKQTFHRSGTASLQAFKLYTQGRAFFFQRGVRLLSAVECFKKAVNLDPEYALAWSALADAFNMVGFYGLARPDACMPYADDAAQRAVALDPALAEAHISRAMSYLLFDWDRSRAEREFLISLKLKPHHSMARTWYGLFYLNWVAGRFEEAVEHTRTAVQLDPLSAWSRAMHACAYLPHDVGRCLETVDEILKIDPDFFLGPWIKLVAFNMQGRFAEAAEIGELVARMSGRFPWVVCSLARTYAKLGKHRDSEALYMELRWRAKREYVSPTILAWAAWAALRHGEAIQLAHEANSIGDPVLIGAKYWPDFADLREDHRFQEILRSRGWT